MSRSAWNQCNIHQIPNRVSHSKFSRLMHRPTYVVSGRIQPNIHNTTFDNSDRLTHAYNNHWWDHRQQIEYITFRNYYCCFISIHYSKRNNPIDWIPLVERLRLMKDAHYEDDAQDWHCIQVKQYLEEEEAETERFAAMKISYFQPSPNWMSYSIKNMSFLRMDDTQQAIVDGSGQHRVTESIQPEMTLEHETTDRDSKKWSNLFQSMHMIQGYQRAYESHVTPSDQSSFVQDIYSLSYEHEQSSTKNS